MPAMSDADRAEGFAEFMREVLPGSNHGSAVKADLRAAYDAIDSYCVTDATTMNAAIPQPARAQMSVSLKALMFIAVLRKRYIKGL